MRYIWLSHLGVYVCVASSWVETRDAVKHPTMDRTAPKTRNYPAPNVNSSETEKPWNTQVSTFLSGIISLHLDDAVLAELWYLLSD